MVLSTLELIMENKRWEKNKSSCLLTIFDAASVVREYLPKRRGIILRVLCEISVINFLVKRVEYNISRKQ